jgi:tetratricopeptide (TPR) repeat protein/DNA-binding SARP family transcriptional activator
MVELRSRTGTVYIGPPRQRAVLAALAVDAGRPVPVSTLVERVWGDERPDRPEHAVRVYVSRLRSILAAGSVKLVTRTNGYLLDLDPSRVDMLRFRQLVDAARRPGSPTRLQQLREALRLWRGEPLADLPGGWAARIRVGWRQLRLDALAAWAEAELAEGDPAAVVAPLTEVVAEHPAAEAVVAQLMLALDRVGRPADALALYTATRGHLAEELGTDPGPALQRLHQSLLRGEIATLPPPVAGPVAAGPPAAGPQAQAAAPRHLPTPPQWFTGRTMELAELGKIHDANTVVITAIDGMAGVGKTALAVQAAHQMVERYPDGQLFIDLHGYTQGVAPVEPGEALDTLLRSLGVPGERIPAGLDQRAALYRSRLADLRVVIVLDNAATEAQVQPLLPGAPGCVVLVTSRRRLGGLDHTHVLSVDTLPLVDALALLRQTAGEARFAGQPPELVTELVELCGRLPLAIRIAAARLRSHPAWDLAQLVRRLRDQQHRLVELQAGQRSVTAALDLSYQDLGADQRRTYRRLGLHVGPDIDAYAAAALLNTTLLEAGLALEHLLEAHLLQEPTPGRYRFHDLTRAHAAHTASRDETDHSGQTALDRLLDYYRHTAAVAMDTAYPYERERRPQVPPAQTPTPALSDPAAALAWLDGELPNVLAAAKHATDHDRPAHLLHLSTILHLHLRNHGPYDDAESLHQQALTAARATGHEAAELEALNGLGHIRRAQGRHEPATDHFGQALRLARATGHQAAELDALLGLAHMYRLRGRHGQAADHFRQALRLARATGHQAAELRALSGLGVCHRLQGRYEQATARLGQALRLARVTGHQTTEQAALTSLGHLHMMRGQLEQAGDHFQQALQLARATGHRTAEQRALASLGDVHRIQGRYEQARDDFQRLLDLAHQSGSRNYQFEAWQGFGRLHHATGHSDVALTHHAQALALASELGQPEDQARAHDGLAHAHHALHRHEQARTHWQHALDILTRLGIDHTDDEETTVAAISAHLTNLDTGTEG